MTPSTSSISPDATAALGAVRRLVSHRRWLRGDDRRTERLRKVDALPRARHRHPAARRQRDLRRKGLDRHRDDVRKSAALLTHASHLCEPLTGPENLRVFANHLGKPRTGLQPLLERVGLAARRHDPVSAYSAGMRKRLSFARVLLQEPRVAMLDEPYGQLDPEGFTLVDDVVRELGGRGTTVLMATSSIA